MPSLRESGNHQTSGTQQESHQWQPETGPPMNSSWRAYIKAGETSGHYRSKHMQSKSQDDDE